MKKTLALPENHPVFGSTKIFSAFQYSPAVEAGGLFFIAGQVGLRADGSVPDSVEEQCELAFRRLQAILEARGLTAANLVELVSYHVDIDEHLAAFRAVKERFVPEPYPSWTIIGVAALARPTLKIEIKAVAAL